MNTFRILVLTIISAMLSTSCVTNARFDKFVARVDYQHDILACESLVDSLAHRTKSDEPDPTRRDEPLPTRRDEPDPTRRDLGACLEEAERTKGNNYPSCSPNLATCVDNTSLGFPLCNQCFDTCMTSTDATWPDAICDLTP